MASKSTNDTLDSIGNNETAETNDGVPERPDQNLSESILQLQELLSQANNSNIDLQEAAATRFVDSLSTEQQRLLLEILEEAPVQLQNIERALQNQDPEQQDRQLPELDLLLSILTGCLQQVFHSNSNVERFTAAEGTTEDTFNNTPRPATFTFHNQMQSQPRKQHLDPVNYSSASVASASAVASTSRFPYISSALPSRKLRDDEASRSVDDHEDFPRKLYRIIKEAEEEGHVDIISFSPSGVAFRVHKPKKFQNHLIPRYFGHNRYSSFRRLLGIYGFRLIQSGPDAGCFCHEYFRRGSPNFCDRIVRREGSF